MRTSIITGAAILASCLAHGQAADKSLNFDAASVKPSEMPTPNGRGMIMMRGPSGGPGTKDPGRIKYPYTSLKTLLMNAYDVKVFQISGPGWLDSQRFDVEATMPPETTKEQFKVMLQNLLADRFKVTIHRETKELPMYTLTVGKNGHKLKPSEEAPPPAEGADPPALPAINPGQIKFGPDGFPILPGMGAGGRGGFFTMMMPNHSRATASKQTMDDLASRLSMVLNHPVTNATDLKGKFDFILDYSPEGLDGGRGGLLGLPAPPPPMAAGDGGHGTNEKFEVEPAANLFSAVQSQLGLKLEAKKCPVDLIVIDHMEKTPTEN
jgi:uncharacterized protein (TIGR03435 family)